MPRKRPAEFSHQTGIAISQLGAFANPCAIQVMQAQTAACFPQAVPLASQPVLQIRPAFRIGKIIREKRPQGSDEPLISPSDILRFFTTAEIAAQGISNDLTNRNILLSGNPVQGLERRSGEFCEN